MLRRHQSRNQKTSCYKSRREKHSDKEQGQTKSKIWITQLLSEIKIHKTLHHKNIVEFDSVF